MAFSLHIPGCVVLVAGASSASGASGGVGAQLAGRLSRVVTTECLAIANVSFRTDPTC